MEIWTSASGVNESASVLFAELGSEAPGPGVTLAVFTRTPVALVAIVPVAANTTLAPTGTFTVVVMSPIPDGALQALPPLPAHVHETPATAVGKMSVTVAP